MIKGNDSDEFEIVMRKICDYTDYVYLHVKGESLTHHYLMTFLVFVRNIRKEYVLLLMGCLLEIN